MARWRLITGHYLNVLVDGEPIEWEYKEVDRTTGKQARKIFPVPMLMDPNDPADCNYPGEIVVCHEGKGQRQDIIFVGDPTPDMEPYDEEAEAISASLRQSWEHPIESLPSTMSDGESAFMAKLMEAVGQAKPVANAPVSIDQYNELKALVEDLKAQLATSKPSSPASIERRT